jgi:hypothetical protein
MIDGIEGFYQRIADSIVPALPEVWHRAWMDAIFYSEHVLFHGSYQESEAGHCQDYMTTRSARRSFEELRESFKRAGRIPWCRARFEMYSTGKFAIQFSYDNCDENGFARFDEAAEADWKRRLATGVPVPLLGTNTAPPI